LRFVPTRYFTNIGVSFVIAFVIGLVASDGIGILGIIIPTTCILMDLRIKKTKAFT